MGIDAIVNNNSLPAAGTTPGSALGKDEFLKLMMIQMRNQDPLNPMDNQAMLSQMAQFSSLEQMSNLNSNMSQQQASQGLMQATGLLGRRVEIIDPNSPPDQPGTITSTVKSVRFTDDGPLLTLENGHVATVDMLLKVEESTQ